MNRSLVFVFSMVLGASLMAQGKLEFEKTIHDFGQIKEVDGAAEYTFSFVNSGDQPIRISGVKASCGCTTPFWTKEEILPGDSGKITARYNTNNRPGAFNKSLRVTSNATTASMTLYIKGHVEPKPRTIEGDLRLKMGAIRLKSRSFNLGRVTTEKIIERPFDVYNEDSIAVTFFPDGMELPEHISIEFIPNQYDICKQSRFQIITGPNMGGNE